MSARAPEVLRSREARIPSYRYPEQAAIALARAARYGMWRARPEEIVPRFEDIREDEAAAPIATALGRGEGWLPTEEVEGLLERYGMPLARTVRVSTPEEAGEAAGSFDGKVVLKGIGPLHKTESGAVRIGLAAGDVLAEAHGDAGTGARRRASRSTGSRCSRSTAASR